MAWQGQHLTYYEVPRILASKSLDAAKKEESTEDQEKVNAARGMAKLSYLRLATLTFLVEDPHRMRALRGNFRSPCR